MNQSLIWFITDVLPIILILNRNAKHYWFRALPGSLFYALVKNQPTENQFTF